MLKHYIDFAKTFVENHKNQSLRNIDFPSFRDDARKDINFLNIVNFEEESADNFLKKMDKFFPAGQNIQHKIDSVFNDEILKPEFGLSKNDICDNLLAFSLIVLEGAIQSNKAENKIQTAANIVEKINDFKENISSRLNMATDRNPIIEDLPNTPSGISTKTSGATKTSDSGQNQI